MPFRFELKKAHHVLLFAIHSMGGVADLSRLFLLLYLADTKHLAKYGSLITGDTYLAMKYGPVPFHILSIFKQLKEESTEHNEPPKSKACFSINDKQQVVALTSYEKDYLSESEVECLFEILQQHKREELDLLCACTAGLAWRGADINGEISIEDMAMESGASTEMISYIKMSHTDEINSFSNAYQN